MLGAENQNKLYCIFELGIVSKQLTEGILSSCFLACPEILVSSTLERIKDNKEKKLKKQ